MLWHDIGDSINLFLMMKPKDNEMSVFFFEFLMKTEDHGYLLVTFRTCQAFFVYEIPETKKKISYYGQIYAVLEMVTSQERLQIDINR